MKLKLLFNISFISLAIVILAPGSTIADDDNKQKWICTSTDLCLKDDAPEMGDAKRFESQNDCRLSCGKYGAIWPMPTGDCSLGNERVHFNPWKVRFNVIAPTAQSSQFVREANRIFVSNLLKECIQNCTLAEGTEILVKITVNSSSLVLDLETDESYNLNIRTTRQATFIEIRAPTVFGARLGLETLSNLVTGSIENGLLLVSAARVVDRPVFAHRGLLLDTARNFIPVRYIRHILDGMAASKLNVFHWHVVDSHSFPLEIVRVPEMSRFGAYSSDSIYSRVDQQNIIKYALMRGIRVIIEIDGPSHAGNGWQWGPISGLGNLAVCLNKMPWRSYCIQPPCGQLNPTNDNMYALLKEIYQDLSEVLQPDETMHMGGDEVHIPCWNSTPEITNAMLSQGYDLSIGSFYKLWAEFHRRNLESYDEVTKTLHGRKTSAPKDVILWSSHLTDPAYIDYYLSKERFIIQTWVEAELPLNTDLLNKGYRIIVSTKNAWYLDHGFWGKTTYYNWRTVYSNVLVRSPQVLGGEVCMWSEFVDENSIEPRIWPRAGAAAERLWSDPKISVTLVESRFYRYRERLIARGIQPDALTPKCFGAYTPSSVYSREDTKNIVKYALVRGIRVLIEIDGPSHEGNGWQWGPKAGLGNLAFQSCPVCYNPPCGQLNPVNNNTYAVLKQIFEDLSEVLQPDETMHMGGDELDISCWNSTREITDAMIQQGYDLSEHGFLKLWSDYHKRNLDAYDDVTNLLHGRKTNAPKDVIVWSSQLTDPAHIEEFLPKERFIIQSWVDSDVPLNADLIAKGYRIIVSTGDAWYLDHGVWGRTPYHNWQKIYNNRLERSPLVLGGEVCMWSEYVDQYALEPRVWPRAGAAAERLWSDPKISVHLSEPRFYRYRERLVARGIHPDTVKPRWCILNEGQC